MPFSWVVDHTRAAIKPASWSGLADYAETVRDAYRRDLWQSMPHAVHVFIEKDAIGGTVAPATRKYDVPLHVIRGNVSISFAGEIAEEWAETPKPVFAYYLGDHDPKGHDIERDPEGKLARYSGLGVVDYADRDADTALVESHLDWVRGDVAAGGKYGMVLRDALQALPGVDVFDPVRRRRRRGQVRGQAVAGRRLLGRVPDGVGRLRAVLGRAGVRVGPLDVLARHGLPGCGRAAVRSVCLSPSPTVPAGLPAGAGPAGGPAARTGRRAIAVVR